MDDRSHDALASAILETVRLPLLTLDENLCVETANDAFFEQFQVDRAETIGRRLYDLGNGQWDIEELRHLLYEILPETTIVTDYRVDHDFERIGRRCMHVSARRIMRPEGKELILLAISDDTEREALKAELIGRIEFADKLIDSVREGLLILDTELRVQSASASFYELFDADHAQTVGKLVYELGDGQWNIPELRQLLEDVLPRERAFDDYEVTRVFDGIGKRAMVLNGRRLDHQDLILLAIRDVTDMRESAEQLEEVAGAAQVGVFDINRRKGTFHWSAELRDILGYPKDKPPVTDAVPNFVHPDDREALARKHREISEPGPDRTFVHQHRIVRPNGEVRWVHMQGRVEAAGDAAEGPACIRGVVLDITERKRAEEKLHESAMLHRALFDSVDEAICLFERVPTGPDEPRDYRYIAMNPTMQEMFGIGDLSGQSIRENFPDEVEAWYDDYDRVLETGEPLRIERESEPQGMVLSMFVCRVDGRQGQYLLAVMQDITARKRAEETLRESAERKAFLLRLSDAIRPLTDPVSVMEASSRAVGECLETDNVAYAEVDGTTGYAVIRSDWRSGAIPSLVGRHKLSDFGTFPDDLARGETVAVENVADDPRTSSPGATAAFEQLGIVAMLDVPLVKKGELIGFLTIKCRKPRRWSERDITIATEAAERIWAAVEQARAEARRDFLLKEVNHRSKNILSLVLAIANSSKDEDRDDFVESFQRRVMALAASQDLLVRGQWKGVRLDDLVHALLGHFGDLLDLRITVAGPPLLVSSKTSETLSMVLHELATNAGKYGALSGTKGRVELEWGVQTDLERGRRFWMSWREIGGPPVSPPAKTGFGSQVIKGVAEGSLWGEVSLDYASSGLVWTLDAPADHCLATDVHDGAARNGAVASRPAAEPIRTGRILIVEDETMIALELSAALTKAGHEVIGPAHTVTGALALLEKTPCDAGVLDVNLGEETSAPVAELLKKQGIPFVAVTGYSHSQLPEALEPAAPLTKPLRIERLLAVLTECLSG